MSHFFHFECEESTKCLLSLWKLLIWGYKYFGIVVFSFLCNHHAETVYKFVSPYIHIVCTSKWSWCIFHPCFSKLNHGIGVSTQQLNHEIDLYFTWTCSPIYPVLFCNQSRWTIGCSKQSECCDYRFMILTGKVRPHVRSYDLKKKALLSLKSKLQSVNYHVCSWCFGLLFHFTWFHSLLNI